MSNENKQPTPSQTSAGQQQGGGGKPGQQQQDSSRQGNPAQQGRQDRKSDR